MISTNALLGAIAGITIFLGLPIARWRGVSERIRGILTLASAGVLVFLFIEIGYQAMESVESTAKTGTTGTSILYGSILVIGLIAGLVGLAWFDQSRRNRPAAGTGDALSVATMIATGIGLHNFSEGLVIGQSLAGGAVSLGTLLVIGFALHNATEGFGIAAPLSGTNVSWGRLFGLGLIGGAPTVFGALLGGVWVNPAIELLFNSLALGSLVYVTWELFRIRFGSFTTVAAMTAVAAGMLMGFGTELVVEVAQSRAVAQKSGANDTSTAIKFMANHGVEPESAKLQRGQTLIVKNETTVPLIFEGNGLYVGEIAVPAGGNVPVTITGAAGQYKLIDERGHSSAANIEVTQGSSKVEPLTDEVNAVGALTVLEGHVRTSKDLHERGVSGKGPDPTLDLKRAGKHAGHPQMELLMGTEPDALNLQKLLRERGVFDKLNDALTTYVKVSGDGQIPQAEIDQKYQAALDATETARRVIAGDAYDKPDFRTRAVRFVLDTAAGEYTTAAGTGQITVEEPGVPGKDNFIEYQDARGFLKAARDLLGPLSKTITPDAAAAYDRLQNGVFASLDPVDATHPALPAEINGLIEQVKHGLGGQV